MKSRQVVGEKVGAVVGDIVGDEVGKVGDGVGAKVGLAVQAYHCKSLHPELQSTVICALDDA